MEPTSTGNESLKNHHADPAIRFIPQGERASPPLDRDGLHDFVQRRTLLRVASPMLEALQTYAHSRVTTLDTLPGTAYSPSGITPPAFRQKKAIPFSPQACCVNSTRLDA